MPPEFRTPSLSPGRVHQRARELTGIHPCWLTRKYNGGLFDSSGFRTCSYCGCIHPGDMIAILERGESRLEETAKPGKLWFVTPNPVGGELVRMGSLPGPVFPGTITHFPPARRMAANPRTDLPFQVTATERLMGHFERPVLEPAPEVIRWPFYAEHTNERQWPEIADAAAFGGFEYALPSP